MTIYLLLILFVLFFNLIKKNILPIIIFIGIFMILIPSFKSLDVGSDSYNYYYIFNNLESLKDYRCFSGTQVLWYYFNKIFSYYFNYNIFLLACYTIIICCCFYAFYKNSKNPLFSILIFILLYFYFSSFNIMRQYIAISIVLVSFVFLNKGYYKTFTLLVFLASGFHFSALLSLLCIFIPFIRIDSKYIYLLTGLSFVIGFFFIDKLTSIIINITIDESMDIGGYNQYLASFGFKRNMIANLVTNFIFLITIYLYKDKNTFYIKLYFLSILLDNLFGSAGHANRFYLYFQVAILFALPNAFEKLNYKSTKIFYIVLIILYAISVFTVKISLNESTVYPYKSNIL